MIGNGQYSGYDEERRDPPPSGRDVIPNYGMREGAYGARVGTVVESAGRRSIGAISKDMIRTFQTTIQKNGRSQQMMTDNAPASAYIKPPLQKFASEGSRIVTSMQQSAIVGGVADGLSSVNDRLGMIRRASTSISTINRNSSDRGIYSSQPKSSWGSSVSAEISSFTTQKVVPFFRRSNTFPGGIVGQPKVHDSEVVSFDYQLMKDTE